MISRTSRKLIWAATLIGVLLPTPWLGAQNSGAKPRMSLDERKAPRQRVPRQTVTIHWQGITLRDAIERLRPLFDETVFIDRRLDLNRRVSLDIEASSSEQVVSALAAEQELGVSRLGKLIYLGPPEASQLRAIAASPNRDAAQLPAELRTPLAGMRPMAWPRLTEPRQLIADIAAQNGWRLLEAERIPHDLWAAGELPDLTAVEQLTVLLFGFDRTFEWRPNDRTIEIVPLPAAAEARPQMPAPRRAGTKPVVPRTARAGRQVYTLRVQEKPVGAVLRELSQRLHWAIQVDEAAIRAAGKSLDQRVSFTVENADREKLLDALLTPAGLEYEINGDQIRILPGRYDGK